MFKTVLLVVAALLVVFLIIVALQSDDYRVSRSIPIAATPAAVFAHVNDLHKFQEWNPWAKVDPQCKNTFEGPAAGKGAIMRWAGNNDVGEGSMTIAESRPGELVLFDMEYIKPFAGKNQGEITFAAQGSQTVVTWANFGKKNFISKAVCLFMNMDKMIGGQFENGLADLKTIAEAEAKK